MIGPGIRARVGLKAALLCGAVAVGSGWGQGASAQPAAEQVTTLEEVAVVARKRAENQQTVPVAITAQSGEQLQQRQIRQPSDLSKIVPSLTVANTASSPTGAVTTLRGQSAGDVLLTFSTPVGYYEDSVNIPHPVGADVAFFDIAQIEVLNGPQGTLYGRNTTGGAINIITRGADYAGYHGFVYGEAGDYSNWKAAFGVNVPIVEDKLALRLAYQHWDRDGFGESLITGQTFGSNRDDDIVRGSLVFDPNPQFTVTAKLEYLRARRTDLMYQARQGFPVINAEWAAEGRPGPADPLSLIDRLNATGDLFHNYSEQRTFERLEGWHAVFDASWDITDDVTLRSISGYHQFTDYRTFDLDAMQVFDFAVNPGTDGLQYPAAVRGQDGRPLNPNQESEQWTQELNLSGVAVDDRLNWLVGAFYSDDKGNQDERSGAIPAITGSLFASHAPLVTNKSWAIFTQNDFKLSDRFSITLGGRYTEEEVGLTKSIYSMTIAPAPGQLAFTCNQGPFTGVRVATEEQCQVRSTGSSTGTSYLVSFNAQVTPDALVYVKTARGFRGEVLQVRAPGPPAEPEIATDYEIGLKSEWFDHRLRVNLAAYQTQYENKQETQIVTLVIGGVPTSTTPVANAATARIRGFEGQVSASPIQGLTLNANFSYIRGTYTDFPRALYPNGDVKDASGVKFGLAPWTFGLSGRYEFPFWEGNVAVQADYAWRDKIPQTVLNVDLATTRQALVDEWFDSVGLLSARAEYSLPDKGLTFSIFATNLLDKEYQLAGLEGLPGVTTGITQEPRMWGVSVRKSFGAE